MLTNNPASGWNGDIGRRSSLSDSGGTLESDDDLGLGTVVRRSHPLPDFTFLGTGPGTRRAVGSSADRLATLSAGDQYVGLDSFGRVIDHHWKTTGGTTDRFAYTYDRNSNRLTKGNAVNSDFDEAYTYDSLNQLTGFDRNSGDRTQAWDFDALGNWDSLTTDGGSPQTRTHNKQNEITAVSGATTPTFDANGNMTTDETGKQYVYDAWNRLKVVKNSGGTTLKTYVYDALGRRVAETAGGATTDFYYSSNWQVLEERDAARTNDTKARYVWSPVYVDAMVLRDRDTADDGTLEERLWVQQDANFNVTALVDDNGDVVERYVYDPYGVASVLDETWSVIGSSAYGWLHLHQGGRLDSTSDLYNFRRRDYSPTLGRWNAIDPIGFYSATTNLFEYLSNNTTIYSDPMGEKVCIQSILVDNQGESEFIGMLGENIVGDNISYSFDVTIEATVGAGENIGQADIKQQVIMLEHKSLKLPNGRAFTRKSYMNNEKGWPHYIEDNNGKWDKYAGMINKHDVKSLDQLVTTDGVLHTGAGGDFHLGTKNPYVRISNTTLSYFDSPGRPPLFTGQSSDGLDPDSFADYQMLVYFNISAKGTDGVELNARFSISLSVKSVKGQWTNTENSPVINPDLPLYVYRPKGK